MSQCVPRWDLDDNQVTARRFNSNSTAPVDPMLDVAHELTWENGQLAMHSLGPPRVLPTKPLNSTTTWDNKPPAAGGTLESIVNQATYFPYLTKASLDGGGDELVPWLSHHRAAAASSSAAMTMDALVPCSNRSTELGGTTCVVGCFTRVGSCSGTVNTQDEEVLLTGKRARAVRFPAEWSSKEQSGSGSETFGRDSQPVTVDTYEKDFGVGFTSISLSHGSPENTKATTVYDHDSVCHSKLQDEGGEEDKKETGKSSVSTKRSRAAAIHNQSERKRREKINQRMKTLQKLVPNSSKTDKASMLDEVIEYLKQLQAQIQMMSRMNLPPMMLPMAMQQQLQMSMMAQMGMGMGMGMGVIDMNTMGRPNIVGISPVLPNPFMTTPSWDGGSNDPLSTFMACQSQPMTMDAYSRMAAMYQQMQQPPASSSKS